MRTRKKELVSDNLKPFVGQLIKENRLKYNYSLEDLSKAINHKKNRQTLHKYENGKLNIPYDILFEIVHVFNIDSDDEALSYDLSRGILNQGRKEELKKALEESIPVYKKLNANGMIVLIGETLDIPYDEQINNIVECLEYVKPVAKENDITLLVEPLNDIDRKNYFLPRSKEVFQILKKVDSPNIKLLFDIYHEQLMNGNLINSINDNIDLIGHFHVADAPGRHEPGTGEINYPNVLNAIEATGYNRYIGLEYRATKPDEETMDFIK